MKTMMKTYTILFFVLCTVIRLDAQTELRPGIIMPKENGSVSGTIEYWDDIRNAERCRFKPNTGVTTTFKPFEIYGYRFTWGKFYISKYIRRNDKTEASFVEYLVKGKKDLYYLRDKKGSHFLIDSGKDTVIEVIYKSSHVYQNDVEYFNEINIHQSYLKAYFKDCPQLFDEIEKIKVPDIPNMIAVTKDYHHFMCADTGCVVFYKKSYKFHLTLEVRYGMIQYPWVSGPFKSQYSYLAHFWLPRFNEHIYLVTGLVLSTINTGNTSIHIYKIPLKIEYLFPFKVIKPKFDGGLNFGEVTTEESTDIGITDHNVNLLADIPVSAGILITPVKSIGIDLSVEGDLFPFGSVNGFEENHVFFSYSFNAGICLRF